MECAYTNLCLENMLPVFHTTESSAAAVAVIIAAVRVDCGNWYNYLIDLATQSTAAGTQTNKENK